MSVPVPVAPLFDFSDWQSTHPTQPLPGTNVDAEFMNGYTATNNLIARLALIQRDDGALLNGIVTLDAMDPAVLDAIEQDMNAAQAAATAAQAAMTAAQTAETNAETAETNAETAQAAAEAQVPLAAAQVTLATNQATAAAVSAAAADASADAAAAAAAVMPPLPTTPDSALVSNGAGTAYVPRTAMLYDVPGNAWDAQGHVVRNAGPSSQLNDLTTRQDVQGMISGSGAVPAPGAGDVNNVLTATAENAFSWQPSKVISVYGRSGIIVAQAGDYTAAQITNVPAGGIAANTVQAAINELDIEKADAAATTAALALKADTATVNAALAGKQDLDATLTALAGLASGANQTIYSTGADAFAMTALSAFGRTLIDDADQPTARGTLGLGTAAVLNVGTGANQVVQLNASSQLPAVSGALLTNLPTAKLTAIRVYTANATWNKPANLDHIVVEGVGGGGAGGGANNTGRASGAGGAAGAWGLKRIAAASLAASVAVTIGTAGAPGAAGNNPGGNGGTTSFGAHISLPGGNGGAGGAGGSPAYAAGGVGGTPSGHDVGMTGQTGGTAFGSATAVLGIAGFGGSNPFGFGGQPPAGTANNGLAGVGYGAGGSGGCDVGSSGLRSGGAGTAGLLIVYEYTT